jgi:four helix bundle protein
MRERRKHRVCPFFTDCDGVSASELEYHLLLAHDLELLNLITYNELSEKVVEVKRMLAALLQKVRAAN